MKTHRILLLALSLVISASAFANVDFNKDGKADLVWRNTVTGDNVVWLMDNGTMIGARKLQTAPPDWELAGTADINRDGNADLQWYHPPTHRLLTWYLDANQKTTGFAYFGGFDAGGRFTQGSRPKWIRDFTGDGNADILWWDRGEPVMLWVMDGIDLVEQRPAGFPMTTDGPVVELPDGLSALGGVRTMTLAPLLGGCCTSRLPALPPDWEIAAAGRFNNDATPDLVLHHPATRRTLIWHLGADAEGSMGDLAVVGYKYVPHLPSEEWRIVAPR